MIQAPTPLLQWTPPAPPCEECRYDHSIAQTPFGRFLLTWKSWKEGSGNIGLGFDETPWGEVVYECWNTIEDAQAWAEREMQRRCAAMLAPPAEIPRRADSPVPLVFGGVLRSFYIFEAWPSIQLCDAASRTHVDLVLMLREYLDNHGPAVTVRFWVTDKVMSFEEAKLATPGVTLSGPAEVMLDATVVDRQQLGHIVAHCTTFRVQGWDLLREFSMQIGKHAWLEITKPENNETPG